MTGTLVFQAKFREQLSRTDLLVLQSPTECRK